MFIILLSYTKPFSEVAEHLPAHRQFLDRCYEQGMFVCSGAQIPREGGVILCRAGSRAEVERLVAEDPFIVEGVAVGRIVEFETMQYAPGFEQFL